MFGGLHLIWCENREIMGLQAKPRCGFSVFAGPNHISGENRMFKWDRLNLRRFSLV